MATEGEFLLDFNDGNNVVLVSDILGSVSGLIFGFTLPPQLLDDARIPVIVPIASGVAVVGFSILRASGIKRMRDAIGRFNAARTGTSYGLQLGHHGVGLVMTF